MRYLTFICLWLVSCAHAQPKVAMQERSLLSAADSAKYAQYVSYADRGRIDSLPIGERVAQTALFFLNTPYVGGLLNNEPETLIVDLNQLDCVTFVDNVLALTTSRDEKSYLEQLKKVRYRNGEISFVARLHYSSDWIYEMTRIGLLKDMSQKMGGKKMDKTIDFMTTHASSYLPFRDSLKLAAMKQVENEINARNCYYIPKNEIRKTEIRTGDILLFVTNIKGLDTSHVGIAYWQHDELYFIHASSVGKRVIISDKTLMVYLRSMIKIEGIMVGRLIEKENDNQ